MPSRSFVLLLTFIAAVSSISPLRAAPISGLTYVDRYVVPYTAGTAYTAFNGTAFGGISGVDYDATSGTYYALSDDRSQNAPAGGSASARFYNLSINFDAAGFTPASQLTINSVTTLKRPDSSTFPTTGVDPESIRKSGGSLYWTSEGAVAATSTPNLQPTVVRNMDSGGNYLADFSTPAKFTPDAVVGQTTGIRNNLAFESLAFAPDGTLAYAATESSLFQDGPRADFASGSTNRIVRFNVATGAATGEFVYATSPIMGATQNATADNGLAELLAVDYDTLLALERSFVLNEGNNIRIYQIKLAGATDVSGLNSLVGQSYTQVSKELLFTLPSTLQGGQFAPDNIEAITFGPTFPDGSRSILLFSDNNFSTGQTTQVVLLKAVPEPSSFGLLLLAALASCGRRRFR